MATESTEGLKRFLAARGPQDARGQRLSGPEIRRQLQQLLAGVRGLGAGDAFPTSAGVVITRAMLEGELTAALAAFAPLDEALAQVTRMRAQLAAARQAQLQLLGALRWLLIGQLGRGSQALAAFGIPRVKPPRKLTSLQKVRRAERYRKTRAENVARRSRAKRRR